MVFRSKNKLNIKIKPNNILPRLTQVWYEDFLHFPDNMVPIGSMAQFMGSQVNQRKKRNRQKTIISYEI